MSEPILKMRNLTKNYILGRQKNAKKAQKAIQKFQKNYEKLTQKNDDDLANKAENVLKIAQELFAKEQYEKSYQAVTGKKLRKRKRDRGTVVHALNGIDLDINKGELVAIMGPSGSGKSTLLNMLGLLDRPTAGDIYINSQHVSTIKARTLPTIRSKELGFVFQSFNLIPTMTALENVMLPLKYTGMRKKRRKEVAKEALEQVDLGDRLNHSPNELSGGQRQRVAIARSIVSNPAIILGDELTGELDSKMTEDIMRLIKKLNNNGQTFVIVTHNPDVAKMCRRVIHMKDGRIDHETKQ